MKIKMTKEQWLKIGEEKGYTKSAQMQLKAYSIDYALGILNSISTIIKGNDGFGKGISNKIAMLKNEMGKGKKVIYTTPKAMSQLEGFINSARALYGWDEIWMTEEQYTGSSLNQGQTAR